MRSGASVASAKSASPGRSAFSPALWAAAVALLAAAAATAHEIGTTRVSVRFAQGRTYDIELVTDAGTLVEKLAAATGAPPPAGLHPVRLESLLATSDETFRRRVQVAFDHAEARPAIAYSVAMGTESGAAPIAIIRLTGEIPAGASHLTWSYGWTFAPYALTAQGDSPGARSTEWLEGNQRSKPIKLAGPEPPLTRLAVARRYLTLGFSHIVPYGLDHVLFVLGISLLARRGRSILWQVSAFTAAHSITLGLGIYGVAAAPPTIVEPLIAISIAYIALENMFFSELTSRRLALVFGFGLLHGMGFAGALKELGMPRSEFATALLTFNIGVEAGQLAVIGTAFLLVGWHCAKRSWYRSRVVIPASALIACTALYWTFERLSF
ncbi:MAG TPA: HupE/UreJ family protein [Bryobacteraceae bacterium]|nr:HupE/UreJ family protein [Bryobacteraceae bacterium]